MVETAPFAVTIPARFDALDGIRPAFRRWLSAVGVGGRDADGLVLAAWEACVNAIEHPVAPTGERLSVTACKEDGRIRVEVRDSGRWREQTAPRSNRGLGLRIVAGMMDRVAVHGGGAGTRVVMWATVREAGKAGRR
jgi:anti-sigma regulatory factor (Ser/Thr protein kinase)